MFFFLLDWSWKYGKKIENIETNNTLTFVNLKKINSKIQLRNWSRKSFIKYKQCHLRLFGVISQKGGTTWFVVSSS